MIDKKYFNTNGLNNVAYNIRENANPISVLAIVKQDLSTLYFMNNRHKKHKIKSTLSTFISWTQ